jgi:hypothetical protein
MTDTTDSFAMTVANGANVKHLATGITGKVGKIVRVQL